AKKLGIKTVSTYANWEYGIRQPDNEMLVKIAELYGVTTDYLLGRTTDSISNDGVSSAFHDYDNITEEEKEYLDLQLEIFRKLKEERKKKRENK
ncbi:hypothetical protein CHH83_05710, partial [Bacillus sp. 7586-K]